MDFHDWPETIPLPFVQLTGKRPPWQDHQRFYESLRRVVTWLRVEKKVPGSQPIFVIVDALRNVHEWEPTLSFCATQLKKSVARNYHLANTT